MNYFQGVGELSCAVRLSSAHKRFSAVGSNKTGFRYETRDLWGKWTVLVLYCTVTSAAHVRG